MIVSLNEFTFRSNPIYEAIPYNRLPIEERQALMPWQQNPESYGILRPKPGHNLPIMAITQDTALIFFTMQIPGPLPDYLRLSSFQDNHALTALILDKIIEIHGPEGYVNGPEALSFLGLESKLSSSKLADLSYRALRYAQDLALNDPAVLSLKLYSYHRLPATRLWLRRLPDPAAVLNYLNLAPGQSNERILKKYWRFLERTEGWLPFGARTVNPGIRGTFCKLYISPQPEALPETFGIIIEILGAKGTPQFKIGCDCYGLFRPDKLVAYYPSKEDLFEAAQALKVHLEGVPVHGVPFTAEAGGDGLLSWGMDPRGLSDVEGLSWRHWITNRLAQGLIMARDIPGGTSEPWRFALERLRLEGVDPGTFVPNASWTGVRGL
jgi:hypothetical protein